MHTIFKKIASFIWPVTKKIPSDINGDLELTWYQGKKVLDTKNANFSYGSLDLILNEAFKTTTIKAKDKVLILGLGGGNFIKKIRQDFNHTGHITAVELDSQIIKIAKEEFGILKDKNTTTLHQDALKFVQETSEKFDFIFVDIFVDNIVPEVFYSLKFWNKITTLLNPKGRFLFNAGITLKETNKIDLITNQLQTNLNITKKRNINGTNTLLFGTKV